MKKRFSLLFILPLALVACRAPADEQVITNFEECVAAGNPVMESYPEQCRTQDGQLFVNEAQVMDGEQGTDERIRVTDPQAGDTLFEDIIVTGEARGTWFFEASFPVELQDSEGNILAQVPAQAEGEWMTTDFVPFTAEFTVDFGGATHGMVILRKDNPSGLPENDASIEIPVLFQSTDL